MKTVKAGIIGTGFAGAAHLEAVRRCRLGEVIAIGGASEEKPASEQASELSVERAYENYLDLIKDPDVEVVHNCAPNKFRFPVNRTVLTMGKHVISENPMANDSREARLLLNATERTGSVHAVVSNYRNYSAVSRLRSMVQTGELGQIYALHGHYLQDWLLYETDYNWRVDTEMGGRARAVSDLGSAWSDLAQFITGLKILEVLGDLKTFVPVRKKSVTTVGTFGRLTSPRLIDMYVTTEDYGSVLLHFEGDVRGAVTFSHVSAGRKNRLFIQVDGSKKSVAWDQEQPDLVWTGNRDQPNETMREKGEKKLFEPRLEYPPGFGRPWADALVDFFDAVYERIAEQAKKKRSKRPPDFATFVDGYRAVVLVDKILLSNRQGRWAKVNV